MENQMTNKKKKKNDNNSDASPFYRPRCIAREMSLCLVKICATIGRSDRAWTRVFYLARRTRVFGTPNVRATKCFESQQLRPPTDRSSFLSNTTVLPFHFFVHVSFRLFEHSKMLVSLLFCQFVESLVFDLEQNKV